MIRHLNIATRERMPAEPLCGKRMGSFDRMVLTHLIERVTCRACKKQLFWAKA